MLQIPKPPFSICIFSVSNGFVSSKIYDKRDDFDFDIVNLPFFDRDVPRCPSYGYTFHNMLGLLECAFM